MSPAEALHRGNDRARFDRSYLDGLGPLEKPGRAEIARLAAAQRAAG